MPRSDVFSHKFPVENGIITDWDDMNRIWHHTFESELKVDPKEHPVLLVASPHNPTAAREVILQSMFEYFQVPALYLANQYVLALCASGRTSGVVMDSGDGVSHAVPVLEGGVVSDGVQRLEVGGRDLTEHMLRILAEQGHAFTTSEGQNIARNIKEKLCYVVSDIDKEKETNSSQSPVLETYTLPDGQVITLGEERFRCPEALFQPSLLGMETEGVHKVVNTSILMCDQDVRKILYGNIVLCGGNTLFPGMEERMLREVTAVTPSATKVKIVASPTRRFAVWVGGSIVASLSDFQKLWITKDMYDEVGSSVLNLRSS